MRKSDLVQSLLDEGFVVTEWTDSANAFYQTHMHDYAEVRLVLAGSITFVTGTTKRTLRTGDRIEFRPGQAHAARVGARGVTYLAGRR